jgi:hypothetical protein
MMSPRRVSISLALILALLLTIDGAGWWWITQRMMTEVTAWEADQAAQGLSVGSGTPMRGGWPFAAEVMLPSVTVATTGNRASWQADQVVLRLSPLHPGTLALTVNGTQTVRVGVTAPTTITAQRLAAFIPLNPPQIVTIEGRAVTARLPAGPLTIGTLNARLDGLNLDLSAARLALPGTTLPFDGAIDSVAARLHVTVPVLVLPDPAQTAAAWVHAGGRVMVDHAALRWGPLDAQGTGTGGLDASLQPFASGTVHLTGYGEAIDALSRAGTIGRNDARVANTLLGLLARPVADGTVAVDVPLALQDGKLSMGLVPLARLQPLTWP